MLIDGSIVVAFVSMICGSHWIIQDFNLADMSLDKEKSADYGPPKLSAVLSISIVCNQCNNVSECVTFNNILPIVLVFVFACWCIGQSEISRNSTARFW